MGREGREEERDGAMGRGVGEDGGEGGRGRRVVETEGEMERGRAVPERGREEAGRRGDGVVERGVMGVWMMDCCCANCCAICEE